MDDLKFEHTFDNPVNFLSNAGVILSGIIVGSGTKPVHDVISSLEKYRGLK